MRWIIVKAINLVIVLIIVTFIVAAIFTGPMAQQKKVEIENNVRQQAIALFRDKTPDMIARECLISVKKTSWIKTNFSKIGDNVIINNTELSNLTKTQKEELKQIVINSFMEVLTQHKNIIGRDAFIDYTSKLVYSRAQDKGIPITLKQARAIVSSFYNQMGTACRKMIIDYRILQEEISAGLTKPWYILSLYYTKMLLTFKPLISSSLATQYWPYQGDRNALHIILERLPYSLALFTTSSVLTLLFAMPLALYGARKPGGVVDNVITAWSIFSVSMPWWWLAMVFIYLFTFKYHIFPSPYNVPANFSWRNPIMVAKMAALPVFTVTILSIGDTSYRIRNILLDIFNEDFITVARAKGVPERIVLRKHVMRAAAPPLVTIVLFSIVMSVFSGAIITELVFNWFGLGRLYWQAIVANDVPVLVELTYITTLLYLIIRFILDILYTILDPRIRRA